jgi:glycosyltransferase involved in cell wall biosynthesis
VLDNGFEDVSVKLARDLGATVVVERPLVEALMAKGKKAAHFLRIPELAGSPPNEALISAYLELGYEVDLFTPGGSCDIGAYGSRVECRPAEYGRRWLLCNALLPFWGRYSLFSGTSEDPLAIVGVLSTLHRRPSIALVDEILSGSYRGDARESWKRLCRFGMRKAELNIVNDTFRIGLLKEYAGLPAGKRIIVYPGCYRYPPRPVDRKLQRETWGIPEDALVLGSSGHFDLSSGADWLIDALKIPGRYGVIQLLGMDPFAIFLLGRLEMSSRIYVEEKHLGWQKAWAQAAAMDIGVAIYKNPAPAFQNTGTSSNRLCMFLAMGVPVIASRQDSFRFLEEFGCGILVDDSRSFSTAVDSIRERLPEMRANAFQCWKDYIRAPERYIDLREAIAGITARQ